MQACYLCEPRSFNRGCAWCLRSDPEQAPLSADQRAAVLQWFEGMYLAERGAFNVVNGFQTRIGSEHAVLGPQQPVAAFERLHVANRAENRSLDGRHARLRKLDFIKAPPRRDEPAFRNFVA